MATLAVKMDVPHAVSVFIDEDTLTVELDDGRTVSVPVAWYPRLLHASKEERANWHLIGKGHGIHWENVDEDISVRYSLVKVVLTLYLNWVMQIRFSRFPCPSPSANVLETTFIGWMVRLSRVRRRPSQFILGRMV